MLLTRPPAPSTGARSGFTLIELLVTVSIIGLLVAILLTVLGAAREQARGVACMSNLHQVGVASFSYFAENDDRVWRYYEDKPAGRSWWFGFESGGPGSGINRPLDKDESVLGPYLETDDDAFNCPLFPYNDADYFQKFDRRAASYGFNLMLGPANIAFSPAQINSVTQPLSETFLFADGIHFDFGTGFNEGHYILTNPGASFAGGYAHYRHQNTANALMLDGSVAGIAHSSSAGNFRTVAGAASGNLVDPATGLAMDGQ